MRKWEKVVWCDYRSINLAAKWQPLFQTWNLDKIINSSKKMWMWILWNDQVFYINKLPHEIWSLSIDKQTNNSKLSCYHWSQQEKKYKVLVEKVSEPVDLIIGWGSFGLNKVQQALLAAEDYTYTRFVKNLGYSSPQKDIWCEWIEFIQQHVLGWGLSQDSKRCIFFFVTHCVVDLLVPWWLGSMYCWTMFTQLLFSFSCWTSPLN